MVFLDNDQVRYRFESPLLSAAFHSLISEATNLFMTCFHEFRIYETTLFFREKILVFFESSCKVSFL